MARAAETLEVHAHIEWIDFDGSGGETVRTGEVWTQAPSLGRTPTWWVMPAGGGDLVRVARAERGRHLGADVAGVWRRAGGRLIAKGTTYREVDERSALAQDTAELARVEGQRAQRLRARVLPGLEEAAWIRVVDGIAAQAAGEDRT